MTSDETKTQFQIPQTIAQAEAVLHELFSSERQDKGLRLRAAVARRILNEKERVEVERLHATVRAIKMLRRSATTRSHS